MKAKVKTWINNVENGMIKTTTDRVLFEIYLSTRQSITHPVDLFNFIDHGSGSVTTDQLRTKLDLKHQTLTAILSQLQDEGIVKVVGEHEQGDSVYSKWAFVYSEYEREQLIEERKAEKFRQWIDRGLNEFWDRLPLEVKIHLKMTREKN
jgi:DNA-binding transcriptional ArsR family regulator